MDVFVTRDSEGKVNAVYGVEQEFPTEKTPDDNQEVLEFLNSPPFVIPHE